MRSASASSVGAAIWALTSFATQISGLTQVPHASSQTVPQIYPALAQVSSQVTGSTHSALSLHESPAGQVQSPPQPSEPQYPASHMGSHTHAPPTQVAGDVQVPQSSPQMVPQTCPKAAQVSVHTSGATHSP